MCFDLYINMGVPLSDVSFLGTFLLYISEYSYQKNIIKADTDVVQV